MGSSASQEEADSTVAQPAATYANVADYARQCRSSSSALPHGAFVTGRGVLEGFPDVGVECDVSAPEKRRAWKFSACLPTGRSDVEDIPCYGPGDLVEFSVVRLRKRNYFARIRVCRRGAFSRDFAARGAPMDYRISFSRYLRSCGVEAQKEQRSISWFGNSKVFNKYFKGRKVVWRGQVVRASIEDAKVRIESREYREDVWLRFPRSAGRNLQKGQRIRFEGTIWKQGGKWLAWHELDVSQISPTDSDDSSESEFETASEGVPQAAEEGTPEAAAVSHDAVDTHSETLPNPRRRSWASGPGATATSSVDDDDDKLCVICKDASKTHAFVPCGHKCVCELCGSEVMAGPTRRICPLCRVPSTEIVKIWD